MIKYSQTKLLFLLIVSVFISVNILSQTRIGNNILKGKVLDLDTKSPIPFAVVFLKNTTIGVSADMNGNYEIKNVPSGEYELIFSQVGFEMSSVSISIYNNKIYNNDARLKPKIVSFNEVEVVAHESTEWKDNLETFIKEFVGQTQNARKCKILKPEVIDFKVDPKKEEFEAFSDSTIVIINKALGYKINLILKKFLIDNKRYLIIYEYLPRFEELKPIDEDESDYWINRRKACFKGSLKHLLVSILRGEADKEGFKIHGGTGMGNLKSGLGVSITQSDIVINQQADSNFYEVKFGSPCIQVSYLAGSNDYSSTGSLVSELESTSGSFIVSKYGEIIQPVNIIKTGSWTNMRLGDALPLNYEYPGD